MARKRYSDEDVLNLLRQIELSLASGSSVETAFGRHTAIIERREKIKKLTIQNRRLNHQRKAA